MTNEYLRKKYIFKIIVHTRRMPNQTLYWVKNNNNNKGSNIILSMSLYLNLSEAVLHAYYNWAPSSEFVSSSIPSWQTLTAHAQPFRGARDLAFCLKVPLDSLLVWASSGGSGETARMRRLAWTFAARIGDNYQIRLTRSNFITIKKFHNDLWMIKDLTNLLCSTSQA